MGGRGSGRRPDFVKAFATIAKSGEEVLDLPNLSGVKRHLETQNITTDSIKEGTQNKFSVWEKVGQSLRPKSSGDYINLGASQELLLRHDGFNAIIQNSLGRILINNELGSADGAVDISGNIFERIKKVTSSRTLDFHDRVVLVDATSGNITITLPKASDSYQSVLFTSAVFIIKRIDSSSNTVTIATNGSETIDGDSTQNLYSLECMPLYTDGNNWWVI